VQIETNALSIPASLRVPEAASMMGVFGHIAAQEGLRIENNKGAAP
jgi:hypothetical protein